MAAGKVSGFVKSASTILAPISSNALDELKCASRVIARTLFCVGYFNSSFATDPL